MASNAVGEIRYEIAVDSKGLVTGIKTANGELKNLDSQTNKASSSVGGLVASIAKIGATATIAGITAATAGIVALSKSAFSAYSDFEQLSGGVETLFKDSADIVKSYAEEAYKTAGLSVNDYLEQATSFSATLIRDTGGDYEKVAKLVDQAIIDMSDNANKMGTSIELIQNAYQGLAKGNATMLDNLKVGYGGTQTEMLKLAKDMGVVEQSVKSFNDITFEDAINAIHEVQIRLGIADTTALEAESTIEGSFKMLSASWKNLMVALGTGVGIDKTLSQLQYSVITFGEQAIKTITRIAENLPTLITQMFEMSASIFREYAPQLIQILMDSLLSFSQQMPLIIKGVSEIIIGITDYIRNNYQAIIEVIRDVIFSLFSGLSEILPVLLEMVLEIISGLFIELANNMPTIVEGFMSLITRIVNVIADNLPAILTTLTIAVMSLIVELTKPENLTAFIEAGIKLLTGLIEAIPYVIEALLYSLPAIIDNLIDFLLSPENNKRMLNSAISLLMAINDAIPYILKALIMSFNFLLIRLWDNIKNSFTQFASNFTDGITGAIKKALNGLLRYVASFVNGLIRNINNFISVINAVPGVSIPVIGELSIPALATGGIVPSSANGQIIRAGEAGEDEWVVPESKMASLVEQMNEKGFGGMTINVYGTFATSDQEQRRVAEQIYNALQDINKNRLGAYL